MSAHCCIKLDLFINIEVITFFEYVPNFLLCEYKHNEKKMEEEYCWAITQAAGQSCCGPSGSTLCVGVWISTAIP